MNESAWSANSDYIIAAAGTHETNRGAISIWNFNIDSDLCEISSIVAHTASCFVLKIDPTFQRMAVGSNDHYISFWNLDDMICYASTAIECVYFNHKSPYKYVD